MIRSEQHAELVKQILKEKGFRALQEWLVKKALVGSSWNPACLEDGGGLSDELNAEGFLSLGLF